MGMPQNFYNDAVCGNDHVWVKCHDRSNPDGCVVCDRCEFYASISKLNAKKVKTDLVAAYRRELRI